MPSSSQCSKSVAWSQLLGGKGIPENMSIEAKLVLGLLASAYAMLSMLLLGSAAKTQFPCS